MSEIFLSRDENNKILRQLKTHEVCFAHKQGRLNNVQFWKHYEHASKHERMRCLLCVSGLVEVPMGRES